MRTNDKPQPETGIEHSGPPLCSLPSPHIVSVQEGEITMMSEQDWDEFRRREVVYKNIDNVDIELRPNVVRWLPPMNGFKWVQWKRKPVK